METIVKYTSIEEKLIYLADVKQIPISGIFELIPLCNMNCDMCYVRLSHEEMEKRGKIQAIDDWLQIARLAKQAGTLFVLLTGGEPLLYPEFSRLYLLLQEMGFIVSINTNGTLIDDEWADFFGKYKPKQMNISLYGASPNSYENLCHYTEGYFKTLQAIRMLKERGVNIKINYSVTPQNAHEFSDVIAITKDWEIPITIDTYMIPTLRERTQKFDRKNRLSSDTAAMLRIKSWELIMDKTEFEQYKTELYSQSEDIRNGTLVYDDKMSCHAGISSFTVTWNGKMQPCLTLDKLNIDVLEYGFQNAWNYIVKETQKLRINPTCKKCIYRPYCRTCASCAMEETGDYLGIPEYMCEYAKNCSDFLK